MAMSLTRPTILGVQWPNGGPDTTAGGAMAFENGGAHETGLAPPVDGSPTATIQNGDGDKEISFEREMQQFGEKARFFETSGCKPRPVVAEMKYESCTWLCAAPVV